MQFSTLALAAASLGSALAQSYPEVTVHVVTVGNMNGSLTYSPDNIVASKGDMVQFQFMPLNHTVTQSNFDNPCEPISLHSNITGVFSGFMPVAMDATTIPTYTIIVNATTPMWVYCSQGKHCQNGMSMVINENVQANATRSLAIYQAMAKNVAKSLAPGNGATEGTAGTTSNTDSGSATSAGGSSSTTSGSTTKATSGATTAFKASEMLSLGALLVVGMALLL